MRVLSLLAPYAVVVASLVAGALGAPVPEEAIVLSAGAAAHRGLVWLPAIAITTFVGVLLTDAIVFAIGHHLGPRALDRRPARWLLDPGRRRRIEALVADHGGKLLIAARFLPGVRAPTLLVLGAHRLPAARFVAWDAIAALVSVPALLAIGYLGSSSIGRITGDVRRAEGWIAIGAVAAISLLWLGIRRRRPAGSVDAASSLHGGDP